MNSRPSGANAIDTGWARFPATRVSANPAGTVNITRDSSASAAADDDHGDDDRAAPARGSHASAAAGPALPPPRRASTDVPTRPRPRSRDNFNIAKSPACPLGDGFRPDYEGLQQEGTRTIPDDDRHATENQPAISAELMW
jgi:hypothetical protein